MTPAATPSLPLEPASASHDEPDDFLGSSGEMASLIREFDWSPTPIGAQETWSTALRTMVRVLLANRFPMLLWWGPEYVSIYNDAYSPILGRKHPWGLGRPVRECWSEIWDVLQPLIDTPFRGGPATWVEDIELQINRSDFTEETHFTVAYSPVPDDAPGTIGGVLATVHEITEKVVGERRGAILRELGARSAQVRTEKDACLNAAQILAKHPKDIPFALLYLLDANAEQARLAASAGLEIAPGLASPSIALNEGGQPGWPLGESWLSCELHLVDNLPERFAALPADTWRHLPNSAAIVPIRSTYPNQLAGFLIAGLSSLLKFDLTYKNFLDLAARQISATLAAARAYEEERNRAEALAEIDRAKTAFFSNVSHEFRTPLTLMIGPLESVLHSDDTVSPAVRDQVETAHRNSLRLLKLVNSLLDFSRIEAGRLKASYEPVDLSSLTTDLASNFRSAMAAAGLELVVDCAQLRERVYVDREMWEKIVLNLLSNAFKFTFEGVVKVSLREEGDRAVMAVRDTGTGIPARELPRIFERFHRVEGARGRTYEGTGIGLALIQELVKLHGGTITVASEIGKGSVFTIVIPFGCAHLPQDRLNSADRDIASMAVRAEAFSGEALTWLARDRLSDPFNDAVAKRPAAKGSIRHRILLADDNADMRDHVMRILGTAYDVTAAGDGLSALKAARECRPDLLISDVMMPGLDGFGLLNALRADSQLRETPVILLSARAGQEARTEGFSAGADDYVTKPFGAAELVARVETTLHLQRLRHEAQEQLREAAKRLRFMAESMPQKIFTATADGSVDYFNKQWMDFTGLPFEQIKDWGWADLIHPDDFDENMRQWRHCLATGEDFQFVHRFRRSDGAYRWHLTRAQPMRRNGGTIAMWIGSNTEIHEQKQTEEDLRRANKALEQFAYTASHDLQEPLRTVKIYSELLTQAQANLNEDTLEYLDHIRAGATRMEAMVRDLLAYTQTSLLDKPIAPVDTGAAARAALNNLAGSITESGATIHFDVLPSVLVHSTQLQQLFQNLIGNAIKYRRLDIAPQIHVAVKRRAENWEFSVSDNGIGIEPEYHDRIFHLFERLHSGSEYSGTGIGLAICQRIVERYHGRIWVESRPGSGSTFYFTFPA